MKKKEKIPCIAYVAASKHGKYDVAHMENQRINYIRDFTKGHDYQIVEMWRRGDNDIHKVNEQLMYICKKMLTEGINVLIIIRSADIASDIFDAYRKAGYFAAKNLKIISIDEGELTIPFHMSVKKE